MSLSPLAMADRIARRDRRDAVFVELIGRLNWPTSAQLAAELGIQHRNATKRLVAMRERGLVIRLGVAKCDSQWALADDKKAQKQAAADRVKHRVRDGRRCAVDVVRQQVVPASRRKLPFGLGPSSVFDLGAMA